MNFDFSRGRFYRILRAPGGATTRQEGQQLPVGQITARMKKSTPAHCGRAR
jgi:hypothetical protein